MAQPRAGQQLPPHIWTPAQTVDLVEKLNADDFLAESIFRQPAEHDSIGSEASSSRARVSGLRELQEKKLCLQLLQRTEWMREMRAVAWVVKGERGLRPGEAWGRANPVGERLEWLKERHVRLCSRLNNYESLGSMPKGSKEREIWDEYRKKGEYDWYFTYHKLWLRYSPHAQLSIEAAQNAGARPIPLSQRMRISSVSEQARVPSPTPRPVTPPISARQSLGSASVLPSMTPASSVHDSTSSSQPASSSIGSKRFDQTLTFPSLPAVDVVMTSAPDHPRLSRLSRPIVRLGNEGTSARSRSPPLPLSDKAKGKRRMDPAEELAAAFKRSRPSFITGLGSAAQPIDMGEFDSDDEPTAVGVGEPTEGSKTDRRTTSPRRATLSERIDRPARISPSRTTLPFTPIPLRVPLAARLSRSRPSSSSSTPSAGSSRIQSRSRPPEGDPHPSPPSDDLLTPSAINDMIEIGLLALPPDVREAHKNGQVVPNFITPTASKRNTPSPSPAPSDLDLNNETARWTDYRGRRREAEMAAQPEMLDGLILDGPDGPTLGFSMPNLTQRRRAEKRALAAKLSLDDADDEVEYRPGTPPLPVMLKSPDPPEVMAEMKVESAGGEVGKIARVRRQETPQLSSTESGHDEEAAIKDRFAGQGEGVSSIGNSEFQETQAPGVAAVSKQVALAAAATPSADLLSMLGMGSGKVDDSDDLVDISWLVQNPAADRFFSALSKGLDLLGEE